MSAHDHSRARQETSFWSSRAFLVCAAFLIMAGILLWTEHLAHALGVLPYLLVLACPLMHIFMHRGHGGHGGKAHRRRTDGRSRQANADQS